MRSRAARSRRATPAPVVESRSQKSIDRRRAGHRQARGQAQRTERCARDRQHRGGRRCALSARHGIRARADRSRRRLRTLGGAVRPTWRPSPGDRPFVIGVTGGIATGKSSVLAIARRAAGSRRSTLDTVYHQLMARSDHSFADCDPAGDTNHDRPAHRAMASRSADSSSQRS